MTPGPPGPPGPPGIPPDGPGRDGLDAAPDTAPDTGLDAGLDGGLEATTRRSRLAGRRAPEQAREPGPDGTGAPSPTSPSTPSTTTSRRRGITGSRPRLPVLPTLSVTRPRLLTAAPGTPLGRVASGGSVLRARTEWLWGPLWRPVRSVLGWVSPLGYAVGALGVLAWVVGARLGWGEWRMIAAACLTLLLCCVLLAVGRTRVRIRHAVDPLRVTVGDPASGLVHVTNLARRPLLPLLVELPIGGSAARFTLPALAPGGEHEELFVVPTERRGVIPVGPARTVQGDPFGLVRRTLEWTELTELFVHPRTISLESLGAGLLRDLEGQSTNDISLSDLAFHALRDYQPGDDRRYIHWRSSAKAGRLLVRQFLDTRRAHLSVVVDVDPGCYAGREDDVETAISAAGSLATRAIMDEQEATVLCGDRTASRTTIALMLDELARAEVGRSDVFARCADAVALAPDTSLAVLVTGPGRPFLQVQRALGQFGTEVRRVQLVVDPTARVGVRTVGGLTLMSIQSVTDLRAVVAGGLAA